MRDAIVIGAGPSGSVAALLLARGGWSVTLIEQHRFPRDKVCGECLSALGVEVLNRLGLGLAFQATGAIPLRRAILHARDGQSISFDLPRPMFGLSRSAFDLFLLNHAARAGATVLAPARCESLDAHSSHVFVRVRDLVTNVEQTINVSSVILADGKSALPGPIPPPTQDFGIKCHWENVAGPRDAIELFGCDGCYGGLSAIENNRWNTAFSVPRARINRHRGDIESLFQELMSENPALVRRLRGATRNGLWLASPLPRFAVRKHWPPNVIPVGNAAAAMEPIGGEGMGLAMHSAELAVNEMMQSDAPGQKWEKSLRPEYERIWRTPRAICRTGAALTSSSVFAPVLYPLLAINEWAAQAVLQAIGK